MFTFARTDIRVNCSGNVRSNIGMFKNYDLCKETQMYIQFSMCNGMAIETDSSCLGNLIIN